MDDLMRRVREAKERQRERSANLPVAEKLALVERMRNRAAFIKKVREAMSKPDQQL